MVAKSARWDKPPRTEAPLHEGPTTPPAAARAGLTGRFEVGGAVSQTASGPAAVFFMSLLAFHKTQEGLPLCNPSVSYSKAKLPPVLANPTSAG